MGLQGVTFGKGRAQEPRLSPPRTGPRHERYWSEAEKDVLREHFVDKGAAFCQARLPERSIGSIYQTANKLGLHVAGITERRSWTEHYPAIDAALKKQWPTLKGKSAFSDFVKRIGFPKHIVSRRAQELGLALPHKREPPWTRAEDALLKKVPLHDRVRASATFRAHGFHRTPTAIAVRCRRIGLSTAFVGGISSRAAADILGIDSKVVTSWIESGWLRAGRRGSRRRAQQGGDPHTIEPADLRQCVLDHLDRIDIRKVDKFAFVELLVGARATTT